MLLQGDGRVEAGECPGGSVAHKPTALSEHGGWIRTGLSPPGGGQGPTSEFILRAPHACYGMDTPPLTNRCVHRGAPAQRIFKKVLAIVIIWEWGTSRKADAEAWASALRTNNYRNLWHNREPLWQLELTDSFRRLSSCATCKMRAFRILAWDQNWGALGSIPSTTNHTNKQTRQWFQHKRREKMFHSTWPSSQFCPAWLSALVYLLAPGIHTTWQMRTTGHPFSTRLPTRSPLPHFCLKASLGLGIQLSWQSVCPVFNRITT